jgi:hypothetical protein
MIGIPGKRPAPRPGGSKKIALYLFIFFTIPAMPFISAGVCDSPARIDSAEDGKRPQSLHLASPSAEITDEN